MNDKPTVCPMPFNSKLGGRNRGVRKYGNFASRNEALKHVNEYSKNYLTNLLVSRGHTNFKQLDPQEIMEAGQHLGEYHKANGIHRGGAWGLGSLGSALSSLAGMGASYVLNKGASYVMKNPEQAGESATNAVLGFSKGIGKSLGKAAMGGAKSLGKAAYSGASKVGNKVMSQAQKAAKAIKSGTTNMINTGKAKVKSTAENLAKRIDKAGEDYKQFKTDRKKNDQLNETQARKRLEKQQLDFYEGRSKHAPNSQTIVDPNTKRVWHALSAKDQLKGDYVPTDTIKKNKNSILAKNILVGKGSEEVAEKVVDTPNENFGRQPKREIKAKQEKLNKAVEARNAGKAMSKKAAKAAAKAAKSPSSGGLGTAIKAGLAAAAGGTSLTSALLREKQQAQPYDAEFQDADDRDWDERGQGRKRRRGRGVKRAGHQDLWQFNKMAPPFNTQRPGDNPIPRILGRSRYMDHRKNANLLGDSQKIIEAAKFNKPAEHAQVRGSGIRINNMTSSYRNPVLFRRTR